MRKKKIKRYFKEEKYNTRNFFFGKLLLVIEIRLPSFWCRCCTHKCAYYILPVWYKSKFVFFATIQCGIQILFYFYHCCVEHALIKYFFLLALRVSVCVCRVAMKRRLICGRTRKHKGISMKQNT